MQSDGPWDLYPADRDVSERPSAIDAATTHPVDERYIQKPVRTVDLGALEPLAEF